MSKFSKNFLVESGYETLLGKRWSMEDAHMIIDNLNEDYSEILSNSLPSSYYAVFDGHGGIKTATLAEQRLHKYILEETDFVSGNVRAAMEKAFKRFDAEVLQILSENELDDGSCAVCCLLVGRSLWTANVGDSEAILVTKKPGKTFQRYEFEVLSRLHRPSDESERKRVSDAGGRVHGDRIAGSLAVSRSFGDYELKTPYNASSFDWVSSAPHVHCIAIEERKHKALILACDGLWDKVSYQTAVDLVMRARKLGKNPYEASEMLAKAALDNGSLDNISIIVVYFRWVAGVHRKSLEFQ